MLLIGLLMSVAYIHYTIEDFKNWREQPAFLKLIMFEVGCYLIMCVFLLLLFLFVGFGFF